MPTSCRQTCSWALLSIFTVVFQHFWFPDFKSAYKSNGISLLLGTRSVSPPQNVYRSNGISTFWDWVRRPDFKSAYKSNEISLLLGMQSVSPPQNVYKSNGISTFWNWVRRASALKISGGFTGASLLHTSNGFSTKMQFRTSNWAPRKHQILHFHKENKAFCARWNSSISHLLGHPKWSLEDVERHSLTFALKSPWESNSGLLGPPKKAEIFKIRQ